MTTTAGPGNDELNNVARASGYQNNCAFHCVALSWLNLPSNKIHDLYVKYPIYKKIIGNFYDYYQLEGEPTLEQFLKILEGFNHPFDKEVLLGPVFRNVLQEEMAASGLKIDEIATGKPIADDRLALLTEKMGAELVIHTDEKLGDILPQKRYDIDDPSWTIEIFHQNIHYNFSYKSREKNYWHNNSYMIDRENNRRLPKKNGMTVALLEDASNVTGVQEQKEAVTQVVKAKYEEIKDPSSSKKSQFSPLAASRNIVGFMMEPKIKAPSLIALNRPSSEKKDKKKYAISSKEFDKKFEERLKNVFPPTSWKHQVSTDKIKITSTNSPQKKISVAKISNGVEFSGSKNTENEIALAANTYKTLCEENHQKISFQVSAQNETQALEFLKNLQENNFDISKISVVHCKEGNLKGESLESFTQKLIAQATQKSPEPIGLRNGP